MIKKISHIIISIFLLFATMGLTLSIHYCGDHIKSVSVVQKAHPCKCHCPACHDKTTFLKISDPFQLTFSKIKTTFDYKVITYSLNLLNIIPQKELSVVVHTTTSPPVASDMSAMLQVFRL